MGHSSTAYEVLYCFFSGSPFIYKSSIPRSSQTNIFHHQRNEKKKSLKINQSILRKRTCHHIPLLLIQLFLVAKVLQSIKCIKPTAQSAFPAYGMTIHLHCTCLSFSLGGFKDPKILILSVKLVAILREI